MSAIVIGVMAYLMVTAAIAGIIVAGLSLLAWLLGAAPTRLHLARSSQKEGERALRLHDFAQDS